MKPKKTPAADRLTVEARLDAIEALHLANPLAPLTRVLRESGIPGEGRPLPERTAKWYVARVRERLEHRATRARGRNRALAIRRLETCFVGAFARGRHKDAAQIADRVADLDGSRLAAEEAQELSLLAQVEELRARTVDWTPAAAPVAAPQLSPAMQRFWLRRALHLASKASDSAAALRGVGVPPEDEGARRLWFQKLQTTAAFLAAGSPGLTPAQRREAIARLASSYAMLARDAELAQELQRFKALLGPLLEERGG